MGPLSSVSSISFTGLPFTRGGIEARDARWRIFVPETHTARDMRTSVRVRQRRRPVMMREMETIMNVVVLVISITSVSATTGMTQKNAVKFYATEVLILILIDVSIYFVMQREFTVFSKGK